MRCFILTTLLLTLPGCSIQNPLFGVGEDTTGSSETDAAASAALTDEPATTTAEPTATSVTTGDEPGTTGVDPATTGSEPGTTGVDPDTTTGAQSGTSGPVDGSSTGIEPEPLPVCPAINDAFAPYLLVNGETLDQCPGADFYIYGKLTVGDSLLLSSGVECGGPNNDVHTLGTGMALAPQAVTKCLKTYLRLVDTADGCKIDQIKSYDPPNGNMLHLAASFSAPPDGLPIQPQASNTSFCGCPDPNSEGPNCCTGLDPGELILLPTDDLGIMVEQFSHATVMLVDNGPNYEFYNLQSWVGPECINDPDAGRHIDWIAVLKQ